MGFFSDLVGAGKKIVANYSNDKSFLLAASAAAANVIAADGEIEDAEIDAAIKGMQSNPILMKSYSASQIEAALTEALNNAKTRAGKIQNSRHIEAVAMKGEELRQDVFLIAADTTAGNSHTGGDIGAKEREALEKIGQSLRLDAKRLLG